MITIVAVKYEESWYKDTLKCLNKINVPIVMVDRKGTGSLAEAYNRGFEKVHTPLVWFISNITFDKEVPMRLISHMSGFDGIHPQFESHHKFIKQGHGVQEAKFIEFTAPLIKSEVYREIRLNEEMPYWGHDIAFGIECHKKGYKLAIDHTVKIGHSYIWDSKEEEVTKKRKALRLASDTQTENKLNELYPEWKRYL